MKKRELLERLETERDTLLSLVEDLPDEAYLEPGVQDDWNLKDLLAHLTMWEAQLITFLWAVRQGRKPDTVHFQDLSDDEINARWQRESRGRSLELVLDDFFGIRAQTIRRVDAFSEAELNNPALYPWLGGHTLVKWILGSSLEHDAEHLEVIRAWTARWAVE